MYVVAIRLGPHGQHGTVKGPALVSFFLTTCGKKKKKDALNHELDKDAAKIMDLLLKHEWHKAQGG